MSKINNPLKPLYSFKGSPTLLGWIGSSLFLLFYALGFILIGFLFQNLLQNTTFIETRYILSATLVFYLFLQAIYFISSNNTQYKFYESHIEIFYPKLFGGNKILYYEYSDIAKVYNQSQNEIVLEMKDGQKPATIYSSQLQNSELKDSITDLVNHKS